jgi:tricorn protease
VRDQRDGQAGGDRGSRRYLDDPRGNGRCRQLTDTSGAAERDPAWSPDGRWIAYFSDESGEYNLYVTQSDGKGETRQLTELSENYFSNITWSPDSEKVLFTDKAGRIHMVTLESASTPRSTATSGPTRRA